MDPELKKLNEHKANKIKFEKNGRKQCKQCFNVKLFKFFRCKDIITGSLQDDCRLCEKEKMIYDYKRKYLIH